MLLDPRLSRSVLVGDQEPCWIFTVTRYTNNSIHGALEMPPLGSRNRIEGFGIQVLVV
jgi:hypothetical protein